MPTMQTQTQSHEPDVQSVTGPALAAAHDPAAALAMAYRHHGRAVYNVALRICGHSVAEEVTQEVFLRFWRDPERFLPERGSLRTYLLTMAHSAGVDAVRANEARRRREERSARMPPAGAPVAPGDRLEADQDDVRVRAALETLPASQKLALVTAFYGECSYRQVAVTLREPEGTVKSRIRMGLQRLAPLLMEPSDDAQAMTD